MNEVDTHKQAPLRETDMDAPAPPREVDMGTSAPWRKAIGRLIGVCIIAGAVVAIALAGWQWQVHPQTDDATVRANFIGVAPEGSGPIVELPVQDNQFVPEGDVLFLVDPPPYQLPLERAKAAPLLTPNAGAPRIMWGRAGTSTHECAAPRWRWTKPRSTCPIVASMPPSVGMW